MSCSRFLVFGFGFGAKFRMPGVLRLGSYRSSSGWRLGIPRRVVFRAWGFRAFAACRVYRLKDFGLRI